MIAAVTLPTRDEILALVPIATMKVELGIVHGRHDEMIGDKIVEAYAYLDGPEGWLNRAILTQTWSMSLGGFARLTEIPIPPLQAVTSFESRGADGMWSAVAADIYEVDTEGLLGSVSLARGARWPETGLYRRPVRMTFRAGYGAAAAVQSRAPGIVRGIKTLAAEYYAHREESVLSSERLQPVIFGLRKSAGRYRIANDHS